MPRQQGRSQRYLIPNQQVFSSCKEIAPQIRRIPIVVLSLILIGSFAKIVVSRFLGKLAR